MDITITLTADQADLAVEHIGDTDAIAAVCQQAIRDAVERGAAQAAAEAINAERRQAVEQVAASFDTESPAKGAIGRTG